ncbi:MAG: nucleotidyltransferase family protein [Deltaproteobacteria bacterium]|nr:nucleotidyltransferase family protein [Deltaproteobacteria bacterium]
MENKDNFASQGAVAFQSEPGDFNLLVKILRGVLFPVPPRPSLFQSATGHGLAGPVMERVDPSSPLLRSIRARTVLQLDVACELLETAVSSRIPVVPLKGTDLIERLGIDPAMRPMSDIDLIVPTDFRADMALLIRQSGYELMDTRADRLDREQEGPWRFVRTDGDFRTVVELHDRPFAGSPLRFADFVVTKDAGRPVLTPEAALYWLARNAAWHGFSERLLFLYDLDRFLRHPETEISAAAFEVLAGKSGEKRLVMLALGAAASLLGTPLGELEHGSVAGDDRLLRRCTMGRAPLGFGPRSLFPILLLDRPQDRFRELWYGLRRTLIGGATGRSG